MWCVSVNGIPVSTICRDTGCSSVIISDAVLPDVDLTGAKNIDVYDYLGHMDTFPVVRCYLRCAYYNGYVDAIRHLLNFVQYSLVTFQVLVTIPIPITNLFLSMLLPHNLLR